MPFSRAGRILRAFVVTVVATAIVLLLAVQCGNWFFRLRAQRLLDDFHSLRANQSTWADAQRLMERWGQHGSYSGSCTAASCEYTIKVDSWWLQRVIDAWRQGHGRILTPVSEVAERMGARPGIFDLGFTVRDGVIVRTALDWYLDVPSFEDSEGHQEVMMAIFTKVRPSLRSTAVADLENPHVEEMYGPDEQLEDHPDYKVDWPFCTGCKIVYITYSPQLAPQEVLRLTSFNISCMTRWRPCKGLPDMLPATRPWHLYERPPAPLPVMDHSCRTDPRASARDADAVLEVEGAAERLVHDEYTSAHAVNTVRVLRMWKPGASQHKETSITVVPFPGDANGQEPAENISSGHRFLLLLPDAHPYGDGWHLGRCGVLEDSPAVQERVRLGLQERASNH